VTELQALSELLTDDPEMIPSIVSVDSRLSIAMSTKDMLALVSRVSAVVPSKELVPGTSMMLIEGVVSSSAVPHIRFSASDGAQWIQVVADSGLRVFTPGSAVVPAKKILEALKLAPASTVKLTVVDRSVTLLSGRARWTFATVLSDRLNTTPVEEDVDLSELPAGELAGALRAVLPAVATSDSRPTFTQAHIEDGSVTATDGARLHRCRITSLPAHVTADIPSRVIARVLDLLGTVDPARAVHFGTTERRIHFQVGDSRIVAQRVLLPFPNVEQIMLGAGMANERSFTVGAERLREAVKRVRINSDPDHSTIFLSLRQPVSDLWALSVRSKDKDGNESVEHIRAQWTGTKPRDLAVNHHHLSAVLSQLHGDYAIVRVSETDTQGSKSPLLFADEGFTAILSQLRTDWIR